MGIILILLCAYPSLDHYSAHSYVQSTVLSFLVEIYRHAPHHAIVFVSALECHDVVPGLLYVCTYIIMYIHTYVVGPESKVQLYS